MEGRAGGWPLLAGLVRRAGQLEAAVAGAVLGPAGRRERAQLAAQLLRLMATLLRSNSFAAAAAVAAGLASPPVRRLAATWAEVPADLRAQHADACELFAPNFARYRALLAAAPLPGS